MESGNELFEARDGGAGEEEKLDENRKCVMKLYRDLIFILLGFLVLGVVLVCLVPASSVMSRIGTGLITGAFIGLINMIVNYIHSRNAFFEKLNFCLFEIAHELGGDYLSAKLRNDDLDSSSKTETILYYKNRHNWEQEEVDKMKRRYEKLTAEIALEEFSGIIPSDRKVSETLADVDRIIGVDVKYLFCKLQTCLSFSMLSVKVTKEEQHLAIGDPDSFYEHLIQNNKEFQSHLASTLEKLGSISAALGAALKRTLPHKYGEYFEEVQTLSSAYLEGGEY